jgi:hypothetical protein
LWEAGASQPDLTTIQAIVVLGGLCSMNGADQLGYSYLKQAVGMAADIDLFNQSNDSTQGLKMLEFSRHVCCTRGKGKCNRLKRLEQY